MMGEDLSVSEPPRNKDPMNNHAVVIAQGEGSMVVRLGKVIRLHQSD